MQFKVASLLRDRDLLPEIRQTASRLLQDQPKTAALLVQRWLHHPEQLGQV